MLLAWLAWIAGSQTLNTLLSDEDWTDQYPRSTATIVDSRVEYSSSTASFRSGTYSCVLIVEWSHEGEVFRDEPVWLHGGNSSDRLEEDCGRARFGEEIEVWIGGTYAAEPYILQPGNRTSKPLTAMVNALQTLFFLAMIWLLWRPRRRRTASEPESDG